MRAASAHRTALAVVVAIAAIVLVVAACCCGGWVLFGPENYLGSGMERPAMGTLAGHDRRS
jgi:hypothetical protein